MEIWTKILLMQLGTLDLSQSPPYWHSIDTDDCWWNSSWTKEYPLSQVRVVIDPNTLSSVCVTCVWDETVNCGQSEKIKLIVEHNVWSLFHKNGGSREKDNWDYLPLEWIYSNNLCFVLHPFSLFAVFFNPVHTSLEYQFWDNTSFPSTFEPLFAIYALYKYSGLSLLAKTICQRNFCN